MQYIAIRGRSQTMWTARGGGGLKILKNGPRYTSKLVHVGGERGSKKSKKRSTWFMDAAKELFHRKIGSKNTSIYKS